MPSLLVAREGGGEEEEGTLEASRPNNLDELTSVIERTCCSSLCMLCTSADRFPTGSVVVL